MRCKTCNYPLWQIRARVCPECGSPFKPGDFEFVVNSVQFRCPHCEQDYYGTGPRGHIEPSEFDCIGCGRRIGLDEMVLLPTEGVDETRTLPGRNPWVERRENTWVGAWFRTVGMAIGEPRALGRHTPVNSSAWRAFVFALVTNLLYVYLGGLWLIAGPLMFVGGATAVARVGGIVAAVLVPLGLVTVPLLILPLVVHGVLRLTGPTERGLKGTSLALWYTSAVNLPAAVPCLSLYVAWIGWVWWAIAAGFALKAIQNCRGWRVAVALAVTGVICAGLAAGGIALIIRGISSAANAASAAAGIVTNPARAGANTALLGMDIREAALAQPPRLPLHAIGLIAAKPGRQWSGSPELASTVTIAGENVETALLSADGSGGGSAALSAIARSLPADVIAHRLGDYVFTYNGLDPASAPEETWTVIYWPHPAWSPGTAGGIAHVARLDGRVDSYSTSSDFDQALRAQNEVRERHGIPRLPHPRTVTHERPATSGGGEL
ncbi:MAG: hypothetical protein ACK4WH_04605 [Phycisphaerales bacterium]